MIIYIIPIILGLGLYYLYKVNSNSKKYIINGIKEVPYVSGSLPYVGHGIYFSKDIIGYIRSTYKKYGKIFKLKIFRNTFIVICDNDLKKEFFKATEDKLSLYEVLDKLYFPNAFSDDPNKFIEIINMIKKTVSIRYDHFIPKIIEETKKMIERIEKSTEEINLVKEMAKFVSYTTLKCFISIDISDEFYDHLTNFSSLLNRIVVLTYFCPKSLLAIYFNPKLKMHRKAMTNYLNSEINKYREDLDKNDSLLFRTGVNLGLTNEEIGNVVVCLLYVSSENTALGISATLIDLAENPKYWDKVKEESLKYLLEDDYKSIYSSPILESCLMESARMTSQILALNRKPKNIDATLGGYYVGDADSIALCEPMMMNYECAEENFKNPMKYNPDRFIEDKEKKGPYEIMTWSAGVHLCPGKKFAIYEIKTVMALITTTFNRFKIPPEDYNKKDYFSSSAFAERQAIIKLEKLSDDKLI